MSSQVPRSRPGALEQRWPLVAAVLPYAMLAFCVLLDLVIDGPHRTALYVDGGLSALAAAWMLWMYTLHPAWRDRVPRMAVFVTGLLVIGALLVITNTLFGIYTFTIFLYAQRLPWPWRQWAVAAVAVLAGTSQAYGVNKTTATGLLTYLVILAVNIAIACGLSWALRVSQEQHDQREQALGELSEANRRLEATLAENAGLQQQLLTQAREAGVLDERQRMAREIHDTLAQGLTGIVTQLQAAEHASDEPAGWRRHFEAATRLARESLSEARRSVQALCPEPLETARLSDAVADVAGRWSALYGVAVQVTTTGTPRPLCPEAESALLRTAQEALANVARHAHATRVGVTLSYMEREVALDVRDDGMGFDPARLGAGPPRPSANGNGGFGMIAMGQRIESLSGTLQVESEPGLGTGISACVPAAPAGVSRAEARA
jgi:signal transduction histidine kinase